MSVLDARVLCLLPDVQAQAPSAQPQQVWISDAYEDISATDADLMQRDTHGRRRVCIS